MTAGRRDVTTEFQIAVFPGDGIGLEVMDACLAVLEALERKTGGYRLLTETLPGGAALYRHTGTALSEENFRKAAAADAILFGAMGLPDVRCADGTEIAPHLEMRREFGLFAGVRPIKAYPNTHAPLAGDRGRPPLRRRHGARPGAPALGVRRAGDGEHVRRHPLGPRGGPGRRHGHGAVRGDRRAPRPVPARPRLGPRYRRHQSGQPHRDAAVGRADARLARRAAWRARLRRRGRHARAGDRGRLPHQTDPADRARGYADHDRGRSGSDRYAVSDPAVPAGARAERTLMQARSTR